MASVNQIETEVLLVGAGPIGIELAVTLQHMGVEYIHLEAGQLAQTITWYPKQTRFFSSPERIAIAGVQLVTPDQTKATREQYLAYLRGVAQQFDLKVNTFEKVTGIRTEDDGTFAVTSHRGKDRREYAARHLVLAIGDMHTPRMLHVPGEDLPHVSHYFDEPNMYFGQRLLIVGGKNSAVEAALRCNRAGARVSVSYRQADFDDGSVKYWLLPELKSLIKAGEITFHPQTRPVRITPTTVELAACEAEGGKTRATVEADFVLLLTGYTQDTTLFEMAGVDLAGENHAPVHDPDTMMTNVPNLYIAGTAAAGTQNRFRLFIENCHPHVTRIARSITGRQPPANLVNQAAVRYKLPES